MLTANEIAARLIDQGRPAFGSELRSRLRYEVAWDEYGFAEDEIPRWEAAGVWCPYVAAVCRDAGVTPRQIGERVDRDFVRLVCQDDRRARDLVEAAR